MLDGVMLLWFLLSALAAAFVAVDIRNTPESPVLKWGFVLLTLYTGPIGAFLYVLGCREPLPGLHERYVAARWRQVLGSTMHCVAGDGVGILAGAILGGLLALSRPVDIALEYVLGFGFGWAIFQALFMRDTMGGSYRRALAKTFLAELVSMNLLMAGMVPVMSFAMASVPEARSPLEPAFWFAMSMALLVGFVTAFPINWWLVARGIKHGMMTVRPGGAAGETPPHGAEHGEAHGAAPEADGHGGHGGARSAVSTREIAGVTVLSFILFALGLGLAALIGGE